MKLPERNLVFVIDRLAAGGAEKLLVLYARALVEQGQRISVLVLRDKILPLYLDSLVEGGVTVKTLNMKRLLDWRAWATTYRCLREWHPTVIHTHLEAANIVGSAIARLMRVPVFSTIHTVELPISSSRLHKRLKIMFWFLKRSGTRVICVSDAVRRYCREFGNLSDQQLITLHNGIAVAQFGETSAKLSSKLRQALNIDENASVIVTTAALREKKGIQHVIAAMQSISDRLGNVYYVVIGDGEYRDELEASARKYSVEDRVRLVGHRDDIPALLSIADIFVLPSLEEALPTVIAEAMAAGLPIVASNIGGIPEMIQDGANGVLVPAGNPGALTRAICGLLEDSQRAARLAQCARQTAEDRFDAFGQIRRLINLYDTSADPSRA